MRHEVEGAGRSWERIQRDRDVLRLGAERPDVLRPCRVGDGISVLADRHEALGRAAAARADAFVPASGAASRFFEAWFAAVRARDMSRVPHLAEASRFPFWHGDRVDFDALEQVLERWAARPKGLIPVHVPGRTLVMEHLDEADALGLDRVHFTVSPAHADAFRQAVGSRATVSVQDPATDTLGFDDRMHPIRDGMGQLVFRPAGHGALFANLDAFARDLVLIKNVDNAVAPPWRPRVLTWRWRLLGLVAELQGEAHSVLQRGSPLAARIMLRSRFGLDVPEDLALERLDRPIRVCGMIRDRGEPGGGPYWCRGPDGLVAPQIVEACQLDPDDPAHARARAEATHFNPVEIAAAVRGPSGRWPLQPYVDREQLIVVRRSIEGVPCRSVEQPGLWNGGMAGWNTVFVEVPEEIFQPLKSVDDLFRPAHSG